MCVILILRPGQMPPLEMLENAVYNNWHSYGLVTQYNGMLDIKRVVPESGEVSPEEVWNALSADKAYERILHLRHNTAGATSLENCHPFDVYFGGKNKKPNRQVVFMHNGTMHSYKSKMKNQYGHDVDDPDGPSDTKNFVDQVLTPLMAGTDFGNGRGDIESDMIKKILSSLWPGGDNRGILISNDQDPLLLGQWETIKPVFSDPKTHFVASNNTYFDRVIRGPEHTRRLARQEEERKKEAQQKKTTSTSLKTGVAALKDFQFERPLELRSTKPVSSILTDWRFYDREITTRIGFASHAELKEMIEEGSKSPEGRDDILQICEWVFTDYAQLYEEYKKLEEDFEGLKEKHKKSTDHIARLATEVQNLKGIQQKVG